MEEKENVRSDSVTAGECGAPSEGSAEEAWGGEASVEHWAMEGIIFLPT